MKSRRTERFRLTPGEHQMGRETDGDGPEKVRLRNDPTLSRRHARLVVRGARLQVFRTGSRHPLLYKGQERDDFELSPGEEFRSGQTIFTLEAGTATPTAPVRSFTMTVQRIDEAAEANASVALNALLQVQPLLVSFYEPEVLFQKLLPILTKLVPGASSHQVLKMEEGEPNLVVSHQNGDRSPPAVSRTLIARALEQDESVCFLWDQAQNSAHTAVAGVSWALATPVGEAPDQYVIYSVGEDAWTVGNTGGTPAELDRALIALVSKLVSGQLQTRKMANLETQVAAERSRRQLADALRQLAADLSSQLEPLDILNSLQSHLHLLVPFDKAHPLLWQNQQWCFEETALGIHEFGGRSSYEQGPRPAGLAAADHHIWLPLYTKDGARACLLLSRDNPFKSTELELVETFVNQTSSALERSILFKEVRHQATHDALTGLYNRRHFYQQAGEMRDQEIAVAILDVDHFKKFNDTHGHDVGDLVLQGVAGVCRTTLSRHGVLARYGGEEFVFATTEVEDASSLCESLIKAVENASFDTPAGKRLSVTISLGLTKGRGHIEQLLKTADNNLYQAKENGRNCVVEKNFE